MYIIAIFDPLLTLLSVLQNKSLRTPIIVKVCVVQPLRPYLLSIIKIYFIVNQIIVILAMLQFNYHLILYNLLLC